MNTAAYRVYILAACYANDLNLYKAGLCMASTLLTLN